MYTRAKIRLPMMLAATLVVVALIVFAFYRPARAERLAEPVSGPRYTVLDTEGHNLIVTDNQSNTVYFYTIDKDKEIGSELKLRGTLDLSQVGKPEIKLTKAKAE
jgi:hypothetical protein